VPDDPYTDQTTGVLYNKLGIKHAADLEAAEREITQMALALLAISPVPPTFDLRHLRHPTRRFLKPSLSGLGRSALCSTEAANYCHIWRILSAHSIRTGEERA
jgi:hypothetical protein